MRALRLVPAALCCLLLTAHFLRSGLLGLALLLAGAPALLFVRRPLVKRLFEVLLVGAVLVWTGAAFRIGAARLEAGEPWLRMALILGAVAAFNLLSLALMRGVDWRQGGGASPRLESTL